MVSTDARFGLHAARMGTSKTKKFSAFVALFAVLSTLFIAFAPESDALAPWSQTDWSGGVASGTITSDVNTYLSQTNAVTSTPNTVTIASDGTWAAGFSAWGRRVPITLTNPGALVTDLQVEIVLPFQSGMKADFSDLRFTNTAGTILPYWLQNKTDGVTSRLWVKVDSLAAAGNTTIFAYYGNAAASSSSDGNSTFNFFDDFTGTTINTTKWQTRVTGTGNSISQNGQLTLNSTGTCSWGSTAIGSNQSFTRDSSNGWVMESDLTTNAVGPCYSGKALMLGWRFTTNFNYTDLNHGYYSHLNSNSNGNMIYEKGGGVSTGLTSPDATTLISITAKPSIGATYRRSSDGGATWVPVAERNVHSDSTLRVLLTNYNTNSTWDNVRVRKFHTSAPAVTIGTPTVLYSSSAMLTSRIFDATFGIDIGVVTFATTAPAGSTIALRLRSGNLADLSDATAFGTCADLVSGADATSACTPNNRRYVQYQVVMSSTGSVTPSLTSFSLAMSVSDIIPPTTNASAVLIRRTSTATPLAANAWSNVSPYISWTAGADNIGGDGLRGYCLYVGSDGSADPVTTKGQLGTSPIALPAVCPYMTAATNLDLAASSVLATPLTSSNATVYVRIKAVDMAGNIFSESAASQQFRFDNTPPTTPVYLNAPSSFVSDKAITINWPSVGGGVANDTHSGLVGLQYRVGLSGIWYGDSHTGTEDETDLLANDGAYQMQPSPDFPNLIEGANLVYFRSLDAAGNFSASEISTVLKINTVSPQPPQNLMATPSANTTNSFAFDWDPPSGFSGAASTLTYCYTVNALPTVTTCTYTAPGVTEVAASAFATQPGDNTFYVVARDEAGNINYTTAASTTFTANTPAPGIPLNLDVSDISLKATSNWKLAISWESPTNAGSGVDQYDVQRSTNGTTYVSVARVSGLSYVEGGLDPIKYYYRVRACDSANNCGAVSTPKENTPTGKFTTPAELVTAPTISTSTRTATIKWATDRQSDSRIAVGTASDVYASTEAADSEQVRNHEIQLDNLNAGTTYYFRARWTDTDGNIGVSSEYTFTTLPAPVLTSVTANNIDVSSASITLRCATQARSLCCTASPRALVGC